MQKNNPFDKNYGLNYQSTYYTRSLGYRSHTMNKESLTINITSGTDDSILTKKKDRFGETKDIYTNILPQNTYNTALLYYDETNEELYFQMPGETQFCSCFNDNKINKQSKKKKKKEKYSSKEATSSNQTNQRTSTEKSKSHRYEHNIQTNQRTKMIQKLLNYLRKRRKEKNVKYFVLAITEMIGKLIENSSTCSIYENWFDFCIRFVYVYISWIKNLNKSRKSLPTTLKELQNHIDLFVFKPLFLKDDSYISFVEQNSEYESRSNIIYSGKMENRKSEKILFNKSGNGNEDPNLNEYVMNTSSNLIRFDSLKKRRSHGDMQPTNESKELSKIENKSYQNKNDVDPTKEKYKEEHIHIRDMEYNECNNTNGTDQEENLEPNNKKIPILTRCKTFFKNQKLFGKTESKESQSDKTTNGTIKSGSFHSDSKEQSPKHNNTSQMNNIQSNYSSKYYLKGSTNPFNSVHKSEFVSDSSESGIEEEATRHALDISIHSFVIEMFNEDNFKKLISTLELYIAVTALKDLDPCIIFRLYKLYNEKHSNFENNIIHNINKLKNQLKGEIHLLKKETQQQHGSNKLDIVNYYSCKEDILNKKQLEADIISKIQNLKECIDTKNKTLALQERLKNMHENEDKYIKKKNKQKEKKHNNQSEEEEEEEEANEENGEENSQNESLKQLLIELINPGGTYKLKHNKK